MSDKTKFYADQSLIAQRMREQFARDKAKGDTRPRCQCGLTWNDVPLMWACQGKDRWAPTTYHCPACLPADLLWLVAQDVANLPEVGNQDQPDRLSPDAEETDIPRPPAPGRQVREPE